MRQRVARSRDLLAEGHAPSVVARVAGISLQPVYRVPRPSTVPQRRPPTDPVEQAIVELAEANQTDGYRMICAFVRRKLGVPVNRTRVLRVMRERERRRLRPGEPAFRARAQLPRSLATPTTSVSSRRSSSNVVALNLNRPDHFASAAVLLNLEARSYALSERRHVADHPYE